MADTAMKPRILERKESHSEKQKKKSYFGVCLRSATESE